MEYVFVILVAALVFGLCYLVEPERYLKELEAFFPK